MSIYKKFSVSAPHWSCC